MTCSTESRDSAPPVGLIGVGVMGKCMLRSLLNAGFRVAAHDPFPAAQAWAEEQGASVVKDPERVAAAADVLVLSLPAGKQVLEVVNALSPALTPKHVVVDTSTVGPETSREGAALAAAKGAAYLDAPVLGRPSGVGNWVMPAGGPEEAVERVRPVLLSFSKKVVRVGDHGTGNIFKLLNQLMFSVINGVSAEVMALADALGVDLGTFYGVIADSGAATVSGLFKETAGRIAAGRFGDPTFTIELLCKDAGLGLLMAGKAGFLPRIAGFVQAINEEAKAGGLAKSDTSALFKIFESGKTEKGNDHET